jgi:hypothetical protein
MAYNREAAVAYADLHWKQPCDDGTITLIGEPPLNVLSERRRLGATGPEWLPRFQQVARPDAKFVERFVFFNPTTGEMRRSHEWEGLADCAHFISRCLTRGGIPLSTDWVPSIVSSLRGLGARTKTLGERVTDYRAKEIVSLGIVTKGDIICYFDGLNKELGGGYVHSAMFVDGTTITCHTRARFGEDWNIKPGAYRHTIIHFADDDASIGSFAPRLTGTWEVTWRGSRFYYHFNVRGGVWWASSRGAGVPEGTGYWFPNSASADAFAICWMKSGSVERYTIESSGKSAGGRWNQLTENEPLSAVKL